LSFTETALSGFDGALLAVSHDQSFLQVIAVEREIRLMLAYHAQVMRRRIGTYAARAHF
jgi:ATPase subunit of ABC transporter with duplicated ATPase domains